MITVSRKTTESVITVQLEQGEIQKDYRSKINTPLLFLNHMIEHIVWRSGMNIGVQVTLDRFDLAHLVAEDVGMTLGKAIAQFAEKHAADGMKGYGSSIGIIDEARALCAVSFESRSLLIFDRDVAIPAQTEGINSEDIQTFLDGFVQGANCTLHIALQRGENGHHIWEAIFRAVGMALGDALEIDISRHGMTAGVAGEIEYSVDA